MGAAGQDRGYCEIDRTAAADRRATSCRPALFVSAIRLIAHDIQAFLEAVIIVAEQQRIFAVLENALAGEVVLQDGGTAAVEGIHRSVMDRVVDRADAQHAPARRNPRQRELHTHVRLQRCDGAVEIGSCAAIGLNQDWKLSRNRKNLQSADHLYRLLDDLTNRVERLGRDALMVFRQCGGNVRLQRSDQIESRPRDRRHVRHRPAALRARSSPHRFAPCCGRDAGSAESCKQFDAA